MSQHQPLELKTLLTIALVGLLVQLGSPLRAQLGALASNQLPDASYYVIFADY